MLFPMVVISIAMGRLSQAVFGRTQLPQRCIVYGGAYLSGRKDVVRRVFDKWTGIKGGWIRYAYARSNGTEYLVVFNVYGGAVTLEVLHLLKDGGARAIFFVGSMYAKQLPVGTLVIPTLAIDRAGLVLVDNPRRVVVAQDRAQVKAIESALEAERLKYERAKIVSVPCVLHDIAHVKKLVANDRDVAGVEMEVSTLHHFSPKIGLRCYALLYVSDNQKYGIISGAKDVQTARIRCLRIATRVALKVLGS